MYQELLPFTEAPTISKTFQHQQQNFLQISDY